MTGHFVPKSFALFLRLAQRLKKQITGQRIDQALGNALTGNRLARVKGSHHNMSMEQ
jgi:hypothetical protein